MVIKSESKLIDRLYEIAEKLTKSMEHDLIFFEEISDEKNTSKIKKEITVNLEKLVRLMIQLNKLKIEYNEEDYNSYLDDEDIINEFLQKYRITAEK